MDKMEAIGILIVSLIALGIRAPFLFSTCGSDVVQFACFADTFLKYKFHFYEYNDWSAAGNSWAYPWKYLYGPVMLFILGPLRELVPGEVEVVEQNGELHVYAPSSWCGALKLVYALFDLLMGAALFQLARSAFKLGRRLSLLITAMYLLNPMTIYVSSIYGMFDSLAGAVMLTGIYLYLTKKSEAVGLFMVGLSVSTKTNVAPTVIIPAIAVLRESETTRKAIRGLLYISLGVMLPFAPFELAYPQSVYRLFADILEASTPTYTLPLVYSFNGVSSLITYKREEALLWVMRLWFVPFLVVIFIIIYKYWSTMGGLALASFLTYLAFTTFYWRVNHQYLVPSVAFVSMLAVASRDRQLRGLASLLYALIGLWPIAYPVSWWAHVHLKSPSLSTWRLLDALSLNIFDDRFYVAHSLALTLVTYALIAYCLFRWNRLCQALGPQYTGGEKGPHVSGQGHDSSSGFGPGLGKDRREAVRSLRDRNPLTNAA